MLPITSLIFAGCNKDYDIKKFYTTFQNIGNNATNLMVTDANDVYGIHTTSCKIDIDYTKSSRLSTLVDDDSTQYYQLKHFYQQLLDDSLSPLYFFGDKISSTKKVSDKQAKKLFNGLYELREDYQDIDYYLGILMNSLNATEDSTINLSYLKKVFVQYEQAITTANNLSTLVCEVYFGTTITNSNYNYSAKTANQLTETDLTRIAVDVRARMYYYKSVYANIYNQLYVRGNDLATQLSSSTEVSIPSYMPYNNLKSILSLKTKPTDVLVANKSAIYDNAVALYNLQNSFTDAYQLFATATSHVEYASLDNSSTADEKNYGNIITRFSNGIAMDSYEIISSLITQLYL